MNRRIKNLFYTIPAALFGGPIMHSDIAFLRGFAQHRIDFCETCGKVLDRPDDPSSIKRGGICLECKIDADLDLENQ